jgi:endoglucanase
MQTWQSVPLVVALATAQGCGGFDPVTVGPPDAASSQGTGGASGSYSDGAAGIPDVPEASTPMDGGMGAVGAAPMGLHVVSMPSPHLEDDAGKTIALRGVNRSGTEYRCVQNATAIFDGASDEPSVQVMASWKISAVRVPLNEACWLALAANGGSSPANSGDAYKNAIRSYVALLQKYGLVPILDLHWVGPGTSRADRLQPLPDADHAPAFWTDVATTFKDNSGVVFEPFNEPFPDSNRDTATAWQCWRDGCTANQAVPADAGAMMYAATGMQALVSAIRAAGATNLVLLGGIEYSNGLSQWATYKPTDPANNLAAAWHVYNFNACAAEACWSTFPASLAAVVPIVATEIGENDCGGTFITSLMQWLDTNGSGYLAWSWNAFGACRPGTRTGQGGRPWSLVTDYASGTPNVSIPDAGVVGASYAKTFHDHVVSLAGTP